MLPWDKKISLCVDGLSIHLKMKFGRRPKFAFDPDSKIISACIKVFGFSKKIKPLISAGHSFLASVDFYRLLITLAYGLEPDQDRLNVGPDLDPKRLTIWLCSWKKYLQKLILKKVSIQQEKHEQLPTDIIFNGFIHLSNVFIG